MFAAVIILAFILGKVGCNKIAQAEAKADSIQLKADILFTKYEDSKQKVIDDSIIYEMKLGVKEIELNKLKFEKEAFEKSATLSISKLTLLANKYKFDATNKDTSSAMVVCEEIVKELDSIYAKYVYYKNLFDSTNSVNSQIRSIDSSENRFLRQSIMQDGETIEALKILLQDALKDNKDLRDALSKTKKGRKWIAIIGFAVGGIIGNQIK